MRTIGAVLSISIIALVATELILRSVAPIYLIGIQRAYRYDEDVGYRLKEGIHEYELKDFLEEVRINGLGTVNYQRAFDPYPVRIYTLGDSYTQGTALPTDAAYPFRLDLALNTDSEGLYHPRHAVINLGLAAFGGEQSLRILQRYIGFLGKPDAVAYLGSDNDYSDDLLFRSGYRHRHIVEGSPAWGPLVGPLLFAGRFEVYKRAKLAVAVARQGSLGSGAGQANPTPSAGARPSVAELTWPVLEKIRAVCAEHDAELVVSWANTNSPSYGWLQERARREGIPFADWWSRVESVRAYAPDAPLLNPHSGGHFRGWVNQVIAEAYAHELRKIGYSIQAARAE